MARRMTRTLEQVFPHLEGVGVNYMDYRERVRVWGSRRGTEKFLKEISQRTAWVFFCECVRSVFPLLQEYDPTYAVDQKAVLDARFNWCLDPSEANLNRLIEAKKKLSDTSDQNNTPYSVLYADRAVSSLYHLSVWGLAFNRSIEGEPFDGFDYTVSAVGHTGTFGDGSGIALYPRLQEEVKRKRQITWSTLAGIGAVGTWDPEWSTSTVYDLAKTIWDSADFSIMPVLADALEDAGCNDQDLLTRLRTPGVFTRADVAITGPLKIRSKR